MFCTKCNEKIQGGVYCYMDKFYCRRECVQMRIEQDNNKELLKVIGPLPHNIPQTTHRTPQTQYNIPQNQPSLQRSNSDLGKYDFYDFWFDLF